MKKLLSAAVAVLALAMAFTGCKHGPDTPAAKQVGTVTLTDDIVIDTNLTYGTTDFANYQVSLDELGKWKLAKNDVIKVTLSATSDYAVKFIQANFVDTSAEAGWWKILNDPKDVIIGGSDAEDAEATKTFSLESEYTIGTAATAKGAAKFVIFVDPKSAGYETAAECGKNGPKKITLTDVTLKIELNGGSADADEPAKDPVVVFDAATTAQDTVEVDGVKYYSITTDGYNKNVGLDTTMDVSEYSKVEVVAYSPDSDETYQFTVQLVDWSGDKGESIAVTFSPAPATETKLAVNVPEGAKKVTHAQVFSQTLPDYKVVSDKVIYIKTITVK